MHAPRRRAIGGQAERAGEEACRCALGELPGQTGRRGLCVNLCEAGESSSHKQPHKDLSVCHFIIKPQGVSENYQAFSYLGRNQYYLGEM